MKNKVSATTVIRTIDPKIWSATLYPLNHTRHCNQEFEKPIIIDMRHIGDRQRVHLYHVL